ncbi:MAG: hypothetical protein OXG81_13630 [Acidobacteria bacterium]|nr:hypothetical protein [Acidobacteriota bacterium]MCY4122960.1 hypothetical protein [Acidobacteriota bacterium]
MTIPTATLENTLLSVGHTDDEISVDIKIDDEHLFFHTSPEFAYGLAFGIAQNLNGLRKQMLAAGLEAPWMKYPPLVEFNPKR